MIDFKELGFNSEDEMLDFMESRADSELELWNQLNK